MGLHVWLTGGVGLCSHNDSRTVARSERGLLVAVRLLWQLIIIIIIILAHRCQRSHVEYQKIGNYKDIDALRVNRKSYAFYQMCIRRRREPPLTALADHSSSHCVAFHRK